MAYNQQGKQRNYKCRYRLERYQNLEEPVTAGLLRYGCKQVVAKQVDGLEQFVGHASVCTVRLNKAYQECESAEPGNNQDG